MNSGNEEETVEDFVNKQKYLLGLELEEEQKQLENAMEKCQERREWKQLEYAGLAVCYLNITSVSKSAHSTTQYEVTLEPTRNKTISYTKLSKGDPLLLRPFPVVKDSVVIRAVLKEMTDRKVVIVVEETTTNFEETANETNVFVVVKDLENITFKRCIEALEELNQMETTHRAWSMRQLLFRKTISPSLETKHFEDSELNASQNAACFLALRHSISCIHGPPGTGKTTTLVSVILRLLDEGETILVCAPSNVAVDNLMEKTINKRQNLPAIRIGHPARYSSTLYNYSITNQMNETNQGQLVNDIEEELISVSRSLEKEKDKRKRYELRKAQKSLRDELKERKTRALYDSFDPIRIVFCTCAGAGDWNMRRLISKHAKLGNDGFDTVIIDEAGQALESLCWIALLKGRKAVLAGDPFQLPPTVKSPSAAKNGLGRSLLDRIFDNDMLKNNVVAMLDIQYRMNRMISNWSSETFYKGLLSSHNSVESHVLCELPGVEKDRNTTIPLLWIDTAGCNCLEETESITIDDHLMNVESFFLSNVLGESKRNNNEVELCFQHAKELLDSGVSSSNIGIISPYAAQVRLLRKRLQEFSNLEISTVDGFQGREKEAIVLSLVRSNDRKELGFLTDYRRINVAITRARRHVCIIGDSEMLQADTLLSGLYSYVLENGQVRFATEYNWSLQGISSGDINIKNKQRHSSLSLSIEKTMVGRSKNNSSTQNICKHQQKEQSFAAKDSQDREALSSSSCVDEKQIQRQLEAFLTSESQSFAFSPSLSSKERRKVHNLADSYHLGHESLFGPQGRYIQIWKTTNKAFQEEESSGEQQVVSLKKDQVGASKNVQRNVTRNSKKSQKKKKTTSNKKEDQQRPKRNRVLQATLFPYKMAWKSVSWSLYPVWRVWSWTQQDKDISNNLMVDEADCIFAELVPRPPEDVYEAQRKQAVATWILPDSKSETSTFSEKYGSTCTSYSLQDESTPNTSCVCQVYHAPAKMTAYLMQKLYNWQNTRKQEKAINELYKLLYSSKSYSEWYNSAELLDKLEGNEVWKCSFTTDECENFCCDLQLLQSRLIELGKLYREGDLHGMVFVVRAGLQRRFAGLCHPDLHKYTHVGTKRIVEDYVHVIAWLLEYLSTADFAGVTSEAQQPWSENDSTSNTNLLSSIKKGFPMDERNQKKREALALQQKLSVFNEMRHSYGRTALLLSGGAKMGLYHLGVAKALLEQRLLPRVISGSSAGAVIASFIGIFRDDELRCLLSTLVNPRTGEKIKLEFFDQGISFKRRIKRLWRKGVLFDIRHLTACMRNNLGDITFAEAYECTKRIINITVAPIRGTESVLLNYLTAPHVLIWSAVGASCALPVIFSPVQLVAKDAEGHLTPYYLEGMKWMDGSINADVPLQRIGELFNVNHFIVSQTNPHVIPRGSRLMKSRLAKMIKAELKFRYWQLNEFGLIPNIVSSVFPVLTQPFEGDVTIMPELGLSDILGLFSNPTEQEIQEYIRRGEEYTFPKIDMVRHHTLIELTLDACVERVGTQLFNLSFGSTKKLSNDARPLWTRRAPSWLWLDTFLSPTGGNSSFSTPSHTPRVSHGSLLNLPSTEQLFLKKDRKSGNFSISRENSMELQQDDERASSFSDKDA
eukprot:jgi/Galph1/5781/GphlegSOOS_G4513.1